MPGACRLVKRVTPGKVPISFCSSSHVVTQIAPLRAPLLRRASCRPRHWHRCPGRRPTKAAGRSGSLSAGLTTLPCGTLVAVVTLCGRRLGGRWLGGLGGALLSGLLFVVWGT